ncbi:hypothetical protein ECZU03_07310 [Escherichia coli]|nr:hypothetical protein ECZU03_07310 [Escherichia coli]
MPVPLRTLWNWRTCPVKLLPYLAWALSVDRWDEMAGGDKAQRLRVLVFRPSAQRHHQRIASGRRAARLSD